MKKQYTQKILTLLISIATLSILLPISTAKAAVVYPEYHPQDLINNESLYNEIIALTIEGDEINSISQIDLSRITNLKEILLVKTAVLDGSILDLERTINKLMVTNSVVNISTFDLNDFDNVWVGIAYNVGEKIDNPKITYWNFLNEEYKNEYPYYGTEYEDRINEIAMNIYESSDKTPQDIIRLVTLYVVENLEYDEPVGDTELGILLDGKKGVCANYASFESILLNKLGIFALDVTGGYFSNIWGDSDQGELIGHAWNIVYTNNSYYTLDPTWLDNEESITALKQIGFGSVPSPTPEDEEYMSWLSNPLKYYMQDMDNPFFNEEHQPQFTSYNLIPVSERISKMSIIPIDNENSGEDNNETLNPPSKNESIKAPDTGLFTLDNKFATASIALIIFATSLSTIFLLIAMTNRIIRKIKIKNF